MSNFNWSGLWNVGSVYQANTFVTWKNVLYVSLNPNISSEPSNTNPDWDIVVYGEGNSYIDRTPLPTITPTPTTTPSVTPTNTQTETPTPTTTPTNTVTNTPSVTPSVTPTYTPTRTVTPTVTKTPTATYVPPCIYITVYIINDSSTQVSGFNYGGTNATYVSGDPFPLSAGQSNTCQVLYSNPSGKNAYVYLAYPFTQVYGQLNDSNGNVLCANNGAGSV